MSVHIGSQIATEKPLNIIQFVKASFLYFKAREMFSFNVDADVKYDHLTDQKDRITRS